MKQLWLTLVLAGAAALVVPVPASSDSNGKAVLITSLLPPLPVDEARLVLHNAGASPAQVAVRTLTAAGATLEDLGPSILDADNTVSLVLNTANLAVVRSLVRSKKGEPKVLGKVFCVVRVGGTDHLLAIDGTSHTLEGEGEATAPEIGASPSSLSFSATVGGANPTSQTLGISNTGGGTLTFSASDNAAWLSVHPPAGTAPATLTVSANIQGLAAGTYNATITVSATGATNSPVSVPVTLSVVPAAASARD